jgi:Sulfatase
VLDFKGTQLDFAARRLHTLGYRTLKVEDDPDLDEEGHWSRRAFDEHLTFADRGRYGSEHAMVGEIERFLMTHDRSHPQQPVLIDWKTAHPHLPYEVPDDSARRDRSFGSPATNYPRALRYVDSALGRLMAFLRARARFEHTLVFVLGDHSNVLSPADTSPLPVDEMVWTGAMLFGSRAHIGSPRRIDAPASQVDVMPTLLARVGDRRPTSALGRDLLAHSPSSRTPRALAIRPGGLRLDEPWSTFLLDQRQPDGGVCLSPRGQPQPGGVCRVTRELMRIAKTYGLLVESNRVWDPRFLKP